VSICTSLRRPVDFDTSYEVHLPIRPYLGRVEHTRLSHPLSVLTRLAAPWFKRRLRALFEERGVTRVHAIPHGLDFAYAFDIAEEMGLPYVLTVHDDMTYNLHDRVYLDEAMRRLATVWREADGRMVISDAMGRAYNERYGKRPYAVVTDGLTDVAPDVRPREPGGLNVYFMGSVHLSYEANFQSMLDALDRVARHRLDDDIRFTVRGGMPFDLHEGAAPLDVLGWGTQDDIEADLAAALVMAFSGCSGSCRVAGTCIAPPEREGWGIMDGRDGMFQALFGPPGRVRTGRVAKPSNVAERNKRRPFSLDFPNT